MMMFEGMQKLSTGLKFKNFSRNKKFILASKISLKFRNLAYESGTFSSLSTPIL